MSNVADNLNDNTEDVTIALDGSGIVAEGEKASEDTVAYEKIIAKQDKLIDTLMERVENLQSQITRYVRITSATVEDAPAHDTGESENSIPENYVYLKDLGAQIGKR